MAKNHKAEECIGKRFGKLVAVEIAGKGRQNCSLIRCVCDCGNEKLVTFSSLIHGGCASCGCLKKANIERLGNLNKTHGKSKTKLYQIWKGMRSRCNNKNVRHYANYGGRGIKVCDEWNDYEKFEKWAYENDYKEGLTIERNDVDKGYSPDNCRWIPPSEQASNRTDTVFIEYKGIKKSIAVWARELNVTYGTLRYRKKKGWSDEEIIEGRRKDGISERE